MLYIKYLKYALHMLYIKIEIQQKSKCITTTTRIIRFKIAKLNDVFFHPYKVLVCLRDPQLQVGKKYS